MGGTSSELRSIAPLGCLGGLWGTRCTTPRLQVGAIGALELLAKLGQSL